MAKTTQPKNPSVASAARVRKKKAPVPTQDIPASSSSAGAAAALAGYDYQLNVSIFAALRLLLIANSADRISLEPANEEDLEADLNPAQPGRVMPVGVMAAGYKLVIQIKLRNGEPWAIEDFASLLSFGKKRTPAKHHLDDQATHYMLITNADAKGVARDLLVSDFEQQSDAARFPHSLGTILQNNPEGRVAIWGGLSERLMEFEIRHILGDLLRVPQQRQGECQNELRNEARQRMRGKNPGVWTRAQLMETIRSFGGYLASAAELETFVPPSNFDAMLTSLGKNNAVIITGSSGTGKTLAALALCEAARKQNGKLNVVIVSPESGPSTARRAGLNGPILFYIEDPWGQYSLRADAESWTTQLPRLLHHACPDLQYVITSRSDMVGHASARESLKRWSTELNAEHYTGVRLGQIYDKRMNLLPTPLKDTALTFRKSALGALETPLELDLFFTNLAAGPEQGETESALLARLLQLANRDAVEHVVVGYLRSLGNFGVPALIWGLLKARINVTRNQLVFVRGAIMKVDPAISDGLGNAIDRLIATRHLRQPAQTVAFAHPSVRAGFEEFMRQYSARSLASLELLITSLVKTADPNWGLETAARVFEAARYLPGEEPWQITIDQTTHAVIDHWLELALLDHDTRLGPLLQLAANVGSPHSNPSALARWLLHEVQSDPFDEEICPVERSEKWYDDMRRDDRCGVIVKRFVREQLPHENGAFASDSLTLLERIAGDLTPSCLATVEALVNAGYEPNLHLLAYGAAREIEAYEPILHKAIDVIRSAQAGNVETAQTWRAIKDGEHDAAYAEYFEADFNDDGYCAGIIADTYVVTQRYTGRWEALSLHIRVSELVRFWARDMARGTVPPASDEINAALAAALSTPDEYAVWDVARSNWVPELESHLASRMLDEPDNERLRMALAHCAVDLAPAVFVGRCNSSATSLLNLLVDIKLLLSRDTALPRLDTVLASLPPMAQQIWRCIAVQGDQADGVAVEVLEVLETTLADAPLRVLAKVVPLLVANGYTGTDAVRAMLAADNADSAAAGAQAAVALGNDELISLALQHPRAKVREIALKHLGKTSPLPLPFHLLALVADRSNFVRRTLVGLLYQCVSEQHVPTIMQLVKDKWSDTDIHSDASESYPIARMAVETLARHGTLEDTLGTELILVARDTADRKLALNAFVVAATLGSSVVRKAIWAVVKDETMAWQRVAAARALRAAPAIEEETLIAIGAAAILQLPSAVAVEVVAIICTHLPVADAVRLVEDAGRARSHRGLLLVAAIALNERDANAAGNVLLLLDEQHPARQLLTVGTCIPSTFLDDLGDVKLQRSIKLWFGQRMCPQPEEIA